MAPNTRQKKEGKWDNDEQDGEGNLTRVEIVEVLQQLVGRPTTSAPRSQGGLRHRPYSCETTPAYDSASCQLEKPLGNSATSLCAISSSEALPSIKQKGNVLSFAFRILLEKC